MILEPFMTNFKSVFCMHMHMCTYKSVTFSDNGYLQNAQVYILYTNFTSAIHDKTVQKIFQQAFKHSHLTVLNVTI
jgi:hypothetical protein